MNHSEAVESQAAEKYLLGELRAGERDNFEDHFFVCDDCADAVRSGMLFVDNAAAEVKAASATNPSAVREPVGRSWKDWFRFEWRSPAFAIPMLALVGVSGLWMNDHARLSDTLADATAPQPLVNLPLDITRGAASATVSRQAHFFAVTFFMEPRQNSEYSVRISGQGVSPASVTIPDRPDGRFSILLPASRYQAGHYDFTVNSGSGSAVRVLQQFSLDLK